MTQYTPPIKERSTEELVDIANAPRGHWQEDAVYQAKKELVRRSVCQREQDKIIEKWVSEAQEFYALEAQRLENNKTESYKFWELIILFLLGPFLFLKPYLSNSHTIFTLRRENYFLKFKQRIIIFALSFSAWFLYINYSFHLSEKNRLEEIQKIDISDWKKQHGY